MKARLIRLLLGAAGALLAAVLDQLRDRRTFEKAVELAKLRVEDLEGQTGMAGEQKRVRFTLVPEPSTLVLAGMGAAALLLFRRRK